MKIKSIILISLIMVTSCNTISKPLVIGHRGAKGHAPENTLKSIQKAIELGVDGIEIDVFRCASGELVVFHDNKTLHSQNLYHQMQNYGNLLRHI